MCRLVKAGYVGNATCERESEKNRTGLSWFLVYSLLVVYKLMM